MMPSFEYGLNLDFCCFQIFLHVFLQVCIIIICYPVCDALSFEINYTFLVKPFFYITKTSGQKCKYLKNEKGF